MNKIALLIWYIILIILSTILLFGCTITMKPNGYNTEQRNIKREYVYDKDGYYEGYIETMDYGTTFYYDKNGRLKGYSIK